MRILYITNGFPYPLTSGYLRHFFLIRGLSRHHEVSLLSLAGRTFRSEHAEALVPYTAHVQTFGDSVARRSKAFKAIRAIRSLLPGAGGGGAVRQMRAAVRRCIEQDRPDVVVFSGKRTYPAIAGLRGIPLVADMCDATSVRLRGTMRHSGIGELPALGLEYLRVRSVERRLAREANHLVFASCRDREAIVGANGNHATVVPNGVDLDYWSRRSAKLGRDTIVMTGAMDYPPNADAALHLIEDVLPRVRRSVPAARLLIVGRDAPARLIEAGRRSGACVTGMVPDVRPYLERASVFAAPLRFGAGIQNKLLEAMAMGVPVVASPLAAEGLRTEEGAAPPVAVAGSADEFAAHIVRKLAETRLDPAPCTASRCFVEQNFVWARSTSKLEQVIAAVAARPVP